jgi:hypothetical protein
MIDHVKELEVKPPNGSQLTSQHKQYCYQCNDKGKVFAVKYVGQELQLIKKKTYLHNEYVNLWVQQSIYEFIQKPISTEYEDMIHQKIKKDGSQFYYWLIDNLFSSSEKVEIYTYLYKNSSKDKHYYFTIDKLDFCQCAYGQRLKAAEGASNNV